MSSCHSIVVRLDSLLPHTHTHTHTHTHQHTLDSDKRDDPHFPRAGYRVKMSHELAGLGGDTIFGKTEMQTEVHQELLKDWVCVDCHVYIIFTASLWLLPWENSDLYSNVA